MLLIDSTDKERREEHAANCMLKIWRPIIAASYVNSTDSRRITCTSRNTKSISEITLILPDVLTVATYPEALYN
jgi:hypothetical protein